MSATNAAPGEPQRLRRAWDDGKNRRRRQRDIADELGVSEAELVASACGDFVTRLSGDFRQLLPRLSELQAVMALTRNDSCVHEKTGVYENLRFDGHVGIALGTDIDLRLFMHQWKLGYALREATEQGLRSSFQFFDASGKAVHKVFLKSGRDDAFDRLVAAFAGADQSPGETIEVPAALAPTQVGGVLSREAFLDAWSNLRDTHEFFGLLKRFEVARTQGLMLAEGAYTRPLRPSCARSLLEHAAVCALPIMVFVGNRGCIQIHTGPVVNIKPMDDWINVLDDGFSLHLRTSAVAKAWVVVKPTDDGVVTSIELFDAHGDNIAMIFGKRKPGVPELQAWRDLVETIAAKEAA